MKSFVISEKHSIFAPAIETARSLTVGSRLKKAHSSIG